MLAHRQASREHFLISGLVGQDNFPEELYVSRGSYVVGIGSVIPRLWRVPCMLQPIGAARRSASGSLLFHYLGSEVHACSQAGHP